MLTTWLWSSGTASPHRSHCSPGRGRGRGLTPSCTGVEVDIATASVGSGAGVVIQTRRRVQAPQHLSAAEVHVHPTRQAGVEAAHRAHDVDPLERGPVVLLED